MQIFVSAGEPSGDLHGANLVAELKYRLPGLNVAGFGGPRMQAAGAELLYPLTELAVMGVGGIAKHLQTFLHLGSMAEQFFRNHRPKALILIDYPGFHWHLARRAHRYGVPVYYFVPPQLWAWASYRVKRIRKHFTAVLTALPFEETWYAERGVRTHYIGHPFFDEVLHQKLDADFMTLEKAKPGTVVALLPGSRTQEVEMNGPVMVNVAKRIHAAKPDVRFLVAAFKPKHAEMMRKLLDGANLPIDIDVGRTPEIIELAKVCCAVSGSVSLELLARRKPTVISYRASWLFNTLAHTLVKLRWFTLVNLLADEELYPEFATAKDESRAIAERLLTWLTDEVVYAEAVRKLDELCGKVAIPGAVGRAADFFVRELDLASRERE
jgi:lipid-A-disaccharide synthase